MIVITNEGFKKIYNIIRTNNKDHVITSDRNNSFWVKNIGSIIRNAIFCSFENEYLKITEQLENFINQNFNSLKPFRDLSIHYDKESTKIYDMLSELNEESSFDSALEFLTIIKEMYTFTNRLVSHFKLSVIYK